MKTLINTLIVVAVFCVCAAMATEGYSPLRAKVDTSAALLGKDVSFARLMRVTFKDGTTEEFLVESIKALTFQANPNDSSNIYDEDEKEDEERSDEPDRTPEQMSSSSVTPSSSSVSPIPDSSSDDSKTPSSESKKDGDVTPSSDSKKDGDVTPSSESKKDDDVTPSSDSKKGDDPSSSSSDEPSAIPVANYSGAKIMWNSRNQTLSIFLRQSGNAKFALFDAQGVIVGSGNVFVSRGSTALALDYLDLPVGNYVIKFEIGNHKLQQTIAVTGK